MKCSSINDIVKFVEQYLSVNAYHMPDNLRLDFSFNREEWAKIMAEVKQLSMRPTLSSLVDWGEIMEKEYEDVLICDVRVRLINLEPLKEAKVEKPPLGLAPKRFVDEKRFIEVSEAIERYTQAKREIPFEWITEYNELYKNLQDV